MDDSLRQELIALTCDLIAIPSTEDRLPELHNVIGYAERYARASPGVRMERIESDGRPSLVATLRDTRTPAVFLNAHLDVVPARPEQFRPELRGGRIYGRGSQDMKGAGAVLLRLMRDLAALPEPPDVGFQFVSDEEIGGFHGTKVMADRGWRCQFFLAAEPTDLQICVAAKAFARFDVMLAGQPAHGSRPWEGVNAIAALRDGLVALERRYPTPDEAAWVTTAVPTIVSGGNAENRLPELITLRLDVRHLPEEPVEEVLAALQGCFPGAEITVRRPTGSPLLTDANDPHVRRLAVCAEAASGRPAHTYREHFASDARFYSELGLPSVCFGPVGAGLHSDEEWVDVDSLVQLYHALRQFATT